MISDNALVNEIKVNNSEIKLTQDNETIWLQYRIVNHALRTKRLLHKMKQTITCIASATNCKRHYPVCLSTCDLEENLNTAGFSLSIQKKYYLDFSIKGTWNLASVINYFCKALASNTSQLHCVLDLYI